MRTRLTTSPTKYLVGSAVVAIVFVFLYLFFVRTHDGQVVDQLAYEGAVYGSGNVAPLTLRVLDLLPLASVVVGLVLTLMIALVRHNWTTFLVALGAAAAAAVTTQVLKYLLPRPDFGVEGFALNSFPSGHTTVAAASALAVFLVASPRTRPTAGAWGTAFAVLAGVATLANQWHRPSDAIAALLVVAFWGCLGGAVLARGRRASALVRPSRGRLLWIALPFVVVSIVAFGITFLRVSSGSSLELIAYIGGVTAIIAAGFLTAFVATRLFARLP